MRATIAAGTLLFAAACGGNKAPAADAASASPPTPSAVVLDSTMMPTADTAAPAGSKSATPTKSNSAGDGERRDSAFGPKFAVDSTGKVTPIKPPGQR
ncbi:MAG: hypothetical protein O2973_00420 [Gemmatimonadetes bacterium]|nr:hypothetical protein [Gemmatimonadota bacterium]